jgi:hypothetical protein
VEAGWVVNGAKITGAELVGLAHPLVFDSNVACEGVRRRRRPRSPSGGDSRRRRRDGLPRQSAIPWWRSSVAVPGKPRSAARKGLLDRRSACRRYAAPASTYRSRRARRPASRVREAVARCELGDSACSCNGICQPSYRLISQSPPLERCNPSWAGARTSQRGLVRQSRASPLGRSRREPMLLGANQSQDRSRGSSHDSHNQSGTEPPRGGSSEPRPGGRREPRQPLRVCLWGEPDRLEHPPQRIHRRETIPQVVDKG